MQVTFNLVESTTMVCHTISMVVKMTTTRGDITPFQFPGGEWHFDIPDYAQPRALTIINDQHIMDDLAIAGLWVDWCKSVGEKAIINLPYLPAARADRGTPFGGKVYANMINALGADEVRVFDPHSSVVPELINNVRVIFFPRVVRHAVFGKNYAAQKVYDGIIAPDKGAVNRASMISRSTNLPLYRASKVRDFKTGKLKNYSAPRLLDRNKKYLVVDDICDGGGTFMLLAQALDLPKEQLGIWVSHGIFSGNAGNLADHYSDIYTTDSVVPYTNVATKVVKLAPYLTSPYAEHLNERNH